MLKEPCLPILICLISASLASTISIAVGSTTSPYSVDFDLQNMIGFNDNTISAEDIVAFIQEKYPNSPMLSEADIGNCFINAGQSNNVNPAFLVATAYLEGRFGTAGWAASHSECHNTLGYDIADTGAGSYSCADSWCAMIQRLASVIAHGNNYYAQGRYSVSQVRQKYATESNEASIADCMNELYSFSINRKSTAPSAAVAGASNTGTQQVSAEPQGTIEGLDSIAWYNKGIALDNSGKHDEAVQAYHNAFSAEPQGTIEGLDAIAWYNKASALDNLGKYDEAVQAYDNAIKLNPRFPPAWFNKAFILSDDLGKYDEAIKCLDTIFGIDPQFTAALYKKCGDFFDQGKYDEAIQCCDKVIELKSGYVASAWAAKGLALKALGRTSEAEEAYAKAEELGWPNTDYRV